MPINTDQALNHLEKGGLLLYPTDTVYGIGCLPEYIHKLLEIKPRESGFIVITDNITKFQDWFSEPFTLEKTKRPTTWVIKASSKVPKALQKDGHLAIREVSHPPTVALLKKLSQPLISTSANYPGQKTPSTISELKSVFDLPVLIGENGGCKPSTIIHYSTKKIIRP